MTDTKSPITPQMNDITTLLEQARHRHQQECERVLADAASGHGPQPWERDWPLGEFDLEDHLSSAAFNPDDTLLCHLLTMVSWALESPLGRKALIADGVATNPGQHTLDTLRVFRSALVERRRELLSSHLLGDGETWAQRCPLGEFNLFEHITTCKQFTPDWFTTGELIEMADWALASDNVTQADWENPFDWQKKKPVIDAIHQFGEGLGIHRRRLLMEQAQVRLRYSEEQLDELERCLTF
jgi:hypothetical protein